MKRTLMLCLALGTACNPVIEPVIAREPLVVAAQTNPPRLAWLFDASGSLLFAADATAAACQDCKDKPCSPGTVAAGCQTRAGAIAEALSQVGSWVNDARVGAAFYPSVPLANEMFCGAANAWRVAVPAQPDAQGFVMVRHEYENTAFQGGTPTAKSLRWVTAQLPPENTDTYVVLVTDGQPNCNNTLSCTPPNSTLQTPATGCPDDTEVLLAGQELAGKNNILMVVTFGPETIGLPVFRAISMGLPRPCSVDADCRSGTKCQEASGLCDERAWHAENTSDLLPAIELLGRSITRSSRCVWWLSEDATSAGLQIDLPGLEQAEWRLTSPRRVRFDGAACDALTADRSLAPVFRRAHSLYQ